jgi:hypothetical protein
MLSAGLANMQRPVEEKFEIISNANALVAWFLSLSTDALVELQVPTKIRGSDIKVPA